MCELLSYKSYVVPTYNNGSLRIFYQIDQTVCGR